jgi:4-amino-4-deoxy-L-arabinose transferase-like glycosyltransferase
MAASFRAFGFSAGAARLVPAFATLGVLLATLWLGCVLFDRRTAVTGAAVLAATGAFVGFGHVAMSDMLLALFSTLAVAIAARVVAGGAHPAWPIALAAALGLGFLTKGPIALLLPGLGIGWLAVRDRASLPRPRPLAAAAAVVVFAALATGWFALVYRRLGWGPLEHFFLRENLQRFAASTYDAQLPFWFYVPTYLAEGAPWSLFFPLAAWHAWRREGGAGRFLVGWFALMLVPLSLSRGKIDYYLLPFYPAASLLVARLFVQAPWEARERAWSRVVLVLGALALAGLPFVVGTMPAGWVPGAAVRGAWTAALLVAAAACAFVALRADRRQTPLVLGASAALVIATLGGLFVPAFHRAQPQSAIVEDVARELRFRGDAGGAAGALRPVGAGVVRPSVPHAAGTRRAPLARRNRGRARDRPLPVPAGDGPLARGRDDARAAVGDDAGGELRHRRPGGRDEAPARPEAGAARGRPSRIAALSSKR